LTFGSNGEERLLEAVLHGKIPITIAIRISGASDEEAQRLLMEAYERKDMNQRTLTSFKRVIDQRRHFGRKYGPRGKEGPGRTSAESMVRAYQRETHRQKIMVKKGKLCEARLLSVSAACKLRISLSASIVMPVRLARCSKPPIPSANRASCFRKKL
jgi:ParB family chromosome partitioning protein